MTKTFDDAGELGREFLGAGLNSFDAVSKDARAISAHATDYAKQVLEAGSSTMQMLMTAKSLDKVVEIQSAYFKQSYEGFVAEATRMNGLYADLAKDACRPFEVVGFRAR